MATHIAGIALEELEVLAAALAVVHYVLFQHQEQVVDDAGHRAVLSAVAER